MPKGNRPDNAQRIDIAKRRRKAVTLRRAGHTWQQIADEVGYASKGVAHRDVQMAFVQEQEALNHDLSEFREEETKELLAQRAVAWESLSSLGVIVHHTKEGETITVEVDDPELALKALDRLNRISARMAALRGLDAPVKVEQSGTVRYEVVGIDTDKLG